MKRRGFFGALAAFVAAPFVPKVVKEPSLDDEVLVYAGFDWWDHLAGPIPSPALKAEVDRLWQQHHMLMGTNWVSQ